MQGSRARITVLFDISKVKLIKLFLQDTANVKSLSISTKSCVLFWHPVETVGPLSARLLIMVT